MSRPGQVYFDQIHPEPERHLRIVLGVAGPDGKVPVVNITDHSKAPSYPLVLRARCHICIPKNSTLAFYAAQTIKESVVDALVEEQKLRWLAPTLLQKVVDSVKNHGQTPDVVRVALGVIITPTVPVSRFLRPATPAAAPNTPAAAPNTPASQPPPA